LEKEKRVQGWKKLESEIKLVPGQEKKKKKDSKA